MDESNGEITQNDLHDDDNDQMSQEKSNKSTKSILQAKITHLAIQITYIGNDGVYLKLIGLIYLLSV